MIIKPSVSFINTDSDADLISRTTGILTAMTGNTAYPTPAPTLAAVHASLTAFSTALSDAQGGGVVLTAAKNAAREALAVLLRELASYVHVACKGDLKNLLSSGFPIQKPSRQPVGVLLPPAGLILANGTRSGELNAWATPVPSSVLYTWRVALVTTPDVSVRSTQSTAASITFVGLTPASEYQVIVNAIGTAGPSDWTDPVTQIII